MKDKHRVTQGMNLIIKSVSRLGARMIVACITALIAATLIFAAPEVGIAGAFGGVILAGISAILIHPHA